MQTNMNDCLIGSEEIQTDTDTYQIDRKQMSTDRDHDPINSGKIRMETDSDDGQDAEDEIQMDSDCNDNQDAENEIQMDSDSDDDQDAEDEIRTETVTKELGGERMDVVLAALFPGQSRSYWQNLIEKGNVTCNGKAVTKAGKRAKAGQTIEVKIPALRQAQILPEDIPLDILYEDDDLIVINKPKGMVVHPAPGHSSGTMVNGLMFHCKDSLSGINGVLRPGIVHRIDRDTTGSIVAAKNDSAHESLAKQLKEHSITRRYRAIVHGNLPEDEYVIDAPIGRHPQDRKKMAVLREGQGTSRRAVTHVRVLERFGKFTYIECELETGRTHQIRVHMAHLNHPVLGDAVYGPKRCPYTLEGQTLHAMVLGFIHPSKGTYMEFTAPLPEYFENLLALLRKNASGLF